MTIKELAQKQGIAPGKIVDEFRKKYPDQKWTIDSKLPEDFVTHYQEFEKTQPQEPVAQVGESAIATADEAFGVAAYKLNQTERVTEKEAIQVRQAQSDLIGEASGVDGGLRFVTSYLKGKQMVLDKFTEETLHGIDDILCEIDTGMVNLAKEASESLGKSIRQKELTANRVQALRSRVAGLSKNMT